MLTRPIERRAAAEPLLRALPAGAALRPLNDLDRGEQARLRQLAWCFVLVGLGLRAARYLLAFPLWCDEYQLAANLLDRNLADLLRPLDNNQVAPIGFLWVEWLVTRLMGFNEWSLRLFPLACGMAALCLFHQLARRCLEGWTCLAAVALFSVSYYPLRLACEVKPYSADLAFVLVVALLLLGRPGRPFAARRAWLLAAATPVGLLISYPSVFVLGAASATIGLHILLAARRGDWPRRGVLPAYLAFNVVLVGSFAGVMQLSAAAQYRSTASEMLASWADAFPPWRQPWKLPVWFLRAHTSEIFAYPVGAENGGSLLTAAAFALGCPALWRRGQGCVVLFQAALFGLTMAAACLERYPYGGHARLAQHLAPGICLIAAAGLGAALERFSRNGNVRWAFSGLLWACLALAVGIGMRDVARPYKDAVDFEHRSLARRLWSDPFPGATFSVNDQLADGLYEASFDSAARCLWRAQHPFEHWPRQGRVVQADGNLPLRCVVYHSAAARRAAGFDQWLQEMSRHYRMLHACAYRVPLASHGRRGADHYMQCYDVYYFEPLDP
jgi:hypothetical protein